MYRVVLYALTLLTAAAIGLSAVGLLAYSAISLIASLLILLTFSWAANEVGAWLRGVPSNMESTYITAYILFFVMNPPSTLIDASWLAGAAVIAMASKYLITWNKQHIVNPAAFGAWVVGSITGLAGWWIGTPLLFPLVLIATLLVGLFGILVGTNLITTALIAGQSINTMAGSVTALVLSGPILFLAGFMATEPFTAPGTKQDRLWYAALIGIVLALPFHVGALYNTPELILIIANVLAFGWSLRRKLILKVRERTVIADNTYELVFDTNTKPTFHPGQYLEWTLPHANADDRGMRRYFTIASSPTEEHLKIGVKVMPGGSSFKEALLAIKPGDSMYGAMRGGDFTLPTNPREKMLFIAGGIGITPFRSMIKYLIDTKQHRDIVLFYSSKTWGEVAYRALLKEAQQYGITTVYCLGAADATATGTVEVGTITEEIITKYVPDYRERSAYLSGPDGMVQAYKQLLKKLGANKIHTDYFPGF
jgi:ferredoxin-NADP reductase